MTNEKATEELDKLISMIQRAVKTEGNYKDSVTLYREALYQQAMKIKKLI